MKILRILLAVLLVLSMAICIISCEEPDDSAQAGGITHTTCVDVDPKDAKCDVCGKDVPCTTCVDASPKDAKCDVCGKDVPCTTCVDASPKDAKCDVCGKAVPCTECVDASPKDGKCDVCGGDVACTHTYADTYTTDGTHHWKAPTCGCDIEPIEKGTHADVSPKNAKCDVCNAEMPCATCVDADPKNAKCDVCGKDVPCVTCVDEAGGIQDATCDVCGKDVVHSVIDASFETTAKDILKNQSVLKITQTSDTAIIGMQIPMTQHSVMIQAVDASGNILQSTNTENYIVMGMGTPDMLFSSSDTTVVQIGTNFYVTTLQKELDAAAESYDETSGKIYVSATQEDIDSLEGQLVEGVDTELSYSVNHFMAINQSTDASGNTVYTCYKLRPESAEAYDQLCENMMMMASGIATNFEMDPDSFIYTVTINSEGRIISAKLEMDISATIEGQTVLYDMASTQEYEYTVDTITAPTDDVNDGTWVLMTINEYFALAQGITCAPGAHVNENDNAFCDNCGGALRCPLGCTDSNEDNFCDACDNEMTQTE